MQGFSAVGSMRTLDSWRLGSSKGGLRASRKCWLTPPRSASAAQVLVFQAVASADQEQGLEQDFRDLSGPDICHTSCRELTGGRPAALAALLAEAPQCVPFEERVLVFRALVSADQEQGRWKVPPAEGGPVLMQLTIRRTHILEVSCSTCCWGSSFPDSWQSVPAGQLQQGI